MIDANADFPILTTDSGPWYEDGDSIPYLIRFRARQARTLDRANLVRWLKAPVVR